MELSEKVYKFIDDVGGVGPNNETRVRNLCKEVAQLESENEALRKFLGQVKAMMRERYQPHVIERQIDNLLKATEE